MRTAIAMSLNLKGLACPLPVVKTARAMKDLPSGEIVEVLSTDPRSVSDFKAWSHSSGNRIVEARREGAVFRFLVRKGGP